MSETDNKKGFLAVLSDTANELAELDWTEHEIEMDVNLQEGDSVCGYYEGEARPIVNTKAVARGDKNTTIPRIKLRSINNKNHVYLIIAGAQLLQKLEGVGIGELIGIKRTQTINVGSDNRRLHTYQVARKKQQHTEEMKATLADAKKRASK